jgi:hypothetical protein
MCSTATGWVNGVSKREEREYEDENESQAAAKGGAAANAWHHGGGGGAASPGPGLPTRSYLALARYSAGTDG